MPTVPAETGTPTMTGVDPSDTDGNDLVDANREDEISAPASKVKVTDAVPEHVVVVADTPKPLTVALPAPVHAKMTVRTLVPAPVKLTFVTEMDPEPRVNDTAGESWRLSEEPLR